MCQTAFRRIQFNLRAFSRSEANPALEFTARPMPTIRVEALRLRIRFKILDTMRSSRLMSAELSKHARSIYDVCQRLFLHDAQSETINERNVKLSDDLLGNDIRAKKSPRLGLGS